MNKFDVTAKNIKCGGCAENIRKGLSTVEGVEEVEVDIHLGKVIVLHKNEVDKKVVEEKMAELGYQLVEEKKKRNWFKL